jgi:DNA polymerase-3 subunit delta'
MFRRTIERNRLAHAYLFAGPAGVGKQLFARLLAQCLFCTEHTDAELEACGSCPSCRQMQAGTHADLIAVGCPPGKRVLPIETFLGVKERRGREGLCHDLSLRPMTADRRIAIVDDAHLMNAESANALLKTLEEPPPRAVLILIASQIDGLLPTIRSRCQTIRFAPLPVADVTELLLELELAGSADEAAGAASMSDGSLEQARQLLDPELARLRETLYEGLAQVDFRRNELAAEIISQLDEIGGETAGIRANALWVLRFCAEFYRQLASVLAGRPVRGEAAQVKRCATGLSGEPADLFDVIGRQLERIAMAEAHLAQSVPVPLCLEGLFDDLGRIGTARSVVG